MSYKSAIFYANDAQKTIALASLDVIKARPSRFAVDTQVLGLKEWYNAETYHQDYYIKKPETYSFYKERCGRVKRLKEVWGEEYYWYHNSTLYNKSTFESKGVDPYLEAKIAGGICFGVFVLCMGRYLYWKATKEEDIDLENRYEEKASEEKASEEKCRALC